MVDDDPLMFDEDEDFNEEPPKKSASLAEIWHSNPSLKLFTVVAVVAAGLVGFLIMGSGEDAAPASRVGSVTSSVTETPGSTELTQAYAEALEKQNEDRLRTAEATGGSVIPTPVGRRDIKIEAPVDQEDDSLRGFNSLAEEADQQRFDRTRRGRASNAEDNTVSNQDCLTQLGDIINNYPAGFQNMYRRLFNLLTTEDHCRLVEILEDLSVSGKKRFLGILVTLSPDERNLTLATMDVLLGQTKERYTTALSSLSRTDKGRLITLMSELADDLQNKLADIMSDLSQETNRRLMAILIPMNDEERRRLIEMLYTLSQSERTALINHLFSKTPQERSRELNRLAAMDDVTLQNSINQITGQSLRQQTVGARTAQPGLSSPQPSFAQTAAIDDAAIQRMATTFGPQISQILESKRPRASVLNTTNIARPFSVQALDQRLGGTFIRPNSQASQATRPYDPNNPRGLTQEQIQVSQGSGTTAGRDNITGSFANLAGEQIDTILYSAGDISYAQVITQANSDIPGPVLAYLASGSLAGGRMIGQFSVSDEKLVMTFNTIVKDKKEYAVNAIALDPETTLPGVASGVDRHYFSRVILPGAVEFIQGFASAVVQQGTSVSVEGETVTSSQNDLDTEEELLAGFEEAANEFADIVDQETNRPITVRVDPGTRIGVLFLEKVENVPLE